MFLELRSFVIFVAFLITVVNANWEPLPADTVPLSYDLHIGTNVHQGKFDFSGMVRIKLQATKDTNEIVLHAKDLQDIKIHLVDVETGRKFTELKYNKIEKYNSYYDGKIVITSSTNPLELRAGRMYLLTISYRSQLQDGVEGFYRVSYNDSQNNEVWLATTHFEPFLAHTAFPCYDDIWIKSKFTVRITHGMNFTAISNMPMDGLPIDNKNGMVTTKFMETPPMSTYTLAFIITNYKYISTTAENITHRLFFPPNTNPELTGFKFGQETLGKFEKYFGISYKIPKMDHIGVPKRFGRAMENWGLTIYKNEWLFQKPNTTDDLVNIALVASHEMAHQWFGNLVTPSSWSHIWLSEGLSSFYSYKILDLMHPEWNIMNYGLCMELGMTVWLKQDDASLYTEIHNQKDLVDLFGYHQYYKAAFILRMLEHALTEGTMKKGVINYLQKFQFASVTETDLIYSLQQSANEDNVVFFQHNNILENMIKSWTREKGHPIIYVTRDYDSNTFTLKQTQYYSGSGTSDGMWWIPITFTTSRSLDFQNTSTDFIFPNTRTMIVDPSEFGKPLNDHDWLILNKEQIGPYRVCYDQRNWKLIVDTLLENHLIIPGCTRAQLIRDAVEFSKIDALNTTILFDLLSYLKKETELVPLYEGILAINFVRKNLDVKHKGNFNEFLRIILSPIFDELIMRHTNNNKAMANTIMPNIFYLACDVGVQKCIESAKDQFINSQVNIKNIPKDMEYPVYCQAIKYGSETDFKNVYYKLIASNDNEERISLLQILPCTENEELLKRLIELVLTSLSSEPFKENEKLTLFISLTRMQGVGLNLLLEAFESGNLQDIEGLNTETEGLFSAVANKDLRNKTLLTGRFEFDSVHLRNALERDRSGSET